MGIYSGRNEMSLSYNDLTLLRYIQKRQIIPLSKTALHFQKNESSIRRTIEQINLYSSEPMVRIEKVSATAASAMKTWFPLSATWTKRIISAPLMNGSG